MGVGALIGALAGATTIWLAVGGGAWARDAAPVAAETASTSPTVPVATVKELMAEILDPAADEVWAAVAVIESADGVEERAPRTDEEWAYVRRHALTVAESGNLLALPGRAVDQETWVAMSRALVEAGIRVVEAVDARDAPRLLDAGELVYAACVLCHQAYWDEDPTTLPPFPADPD